MKKIVKGFFILLLIAFMFAPVICAIAADMTSASVTIAVTKSRMLAGSEKVRMNDFTMTCANGSATYPSTGIPMPAASSFGMVRSVTQLIVTDTSSVFTASTSSNSVSWDKTNNTLFLHRFTQTGEAAITTINTNQRIMKGIAVGY